MKEFKYVVYETTNNLNNKKYIGVHKMKIDSIFDGYFGSGHLIKSALSKYGVENFTFTILYSYCDKTEAYKKERELVDKEFVDRSDTYNMCIGGLGGSLEGTHESTYLLRLKNCEDKGLPYNYWMNNPEIRDKNYKVQISNAKARGGFRGDHMQDKEVRKRANKAISESSKSILSEYDLSGNLISIYKGVRSTIDPPKLPVPLWSALENRDPFRIWVKEKSTFSKEFTNKLECPTSIIELFNDSIISISSPNLRNMGRSCEGLKSRDYRRLRTESNFVTYLDYKKRSTTKLDSKESREGSSDPVTESILRDDDIV